LITSPSTTVPTSNDPTPPATVIEKPPPDPTSSVEKDIKHEPDDDILN
jgi:hypothetical protein